MGREGWDRLKPSAIAGGLLWLHHPKLAAMVHRCRRRRRRRRLRLRLGCRRLPSAALVSLSRVAGAGSPVDRTCSRRRAASPRWRHPYRRSRCGSRESAYEQSRSLLGELLPSSVRAPLWWSASLVPLRQLMSSAAAAAQHVRRTTDPAGGTPQAGHAQPNGRSTKGGWRARGCCAGERATKEEGAQQQRGDGPRAAKNALRGGNRRGARGKQQQTREGGPGHRQDLHLHSGAIQFFLLASCGPHGAVQLSFEFWS